MNKISAIICTHNRYDVLPSAIASLFEQNLPQHEIEIIVVDNSTDQSEAKLNASRYASVDNLRYITEAKPGLANARNVGAHSATGAIVAYMDDDAIADKGWARSLIETYEGFLPRPAVVGGKVDPIWLSPKPDWLTPDLEWAFSIVDRGPRTRQLASDEWLAGCNISFDREALLFHGGFPTHLGRNGTLSLLSNEEDDLVNSIKNAGNTIVYTPSALVYHQIDPQRINPGWLKRRVAWSAVSDVISKPEVARARSAEAKGNFKRLSIFKKLQFVSELFENKKAVDSTVLNQIYEFMLFTLSREN